MQLLQLGQHQAQLGQHLVQHQAQLGQPLAQRLGAHPGDWVTVLVTTDDGLTNAADFQLVGLVRTGVRTLDRTLARFPLDASLSLTAAVEADVLVVALKDTDDTDFVMEAARQLTTEHPGLAVRPWYEQAHYYIAVKALYDRIFGIFQLLMLAVAGLAMSHAVAAVVVQRRAEIALLRVIGLKRRQILWLFLSEGALLGLLGGMGGVILANLVATVTASLGGIPMPPPPGFADGYSAQFHLAAWGYLVVLPTTLIVAMAASSAPAVRASRGALSRALMTALLLLSMLPTSASAQDRLARADAANALPVDQVCTVQLLVTEGENKVAWEVNIKGTRSLARTLSLPAERAQVVLYDGDQTWFQTAAMRGPMRIGTSQRLAGRLPLADLMARPLAERWEITEERVDTVLVQARPGGTGAYASAELDFEGDQLVAARMAGPSGRVVHSATWNWREDSVQVEITGARNRGGTTVVTATKPRCEPGELAIDAADLGGLLSPG